MIESEPGFSLLFRRALTRAGARVARKRCDLADLLAHGRRRVAHRLQLAERDMARHVFHAAVGRDDQAIRGDVLQPVADPVRDHLGGLDLGIGVIEYAEHDLLR